MLSESSAKSPWQRCSGAGGPPTGTVSKVHVWPTGYDFTKWGKGTTFCSLLFTLKEYILLDLLDIFVVLHVTP